MDESISNEIFTIKMKMQVIIGGSKSAKNSWSWWRWIIFWVSMEIEDILN